MTIQELTALWNREKGAFESKELGGLQSFVRKVLECKELFALTEGEESKDHHRRKSEFTIETRKGSKSGQADFVIFMKGTETVIPIEVEKFNNIKAGEKQILRYQMEWHGKQPNYGILTDGFHWRFYNNTVYREFKLDWIFENTGTFQTFWTEYTKSENYYLSFFEDSNPQQALFDAETIFNVEESRELFFEDITNLIRNFRDKLNIAGYFSDSEPKEREKKATEITYAYFIQFILYKTLVDNDYGEFKTEFKDRIDAIHDTLNSGLKSHNFGEILLQVNGIAGVVAEKLYRPFSKEQEFIQDKLKALLAKPKKSIDDVAPWLDIIVFIKKYSFADIKNDIFGFIYENYLKELYEHQNKGQFFTDPAVVNFMLEQIGYTKSEVAERIKQGSQEGVSIVDPSCGSGTFLYSATDRMIESIFDGSQGSSKRAELYLNENIVGFDIAEFPLYLAEMGILMRMLPLVLNEKYNNPVQKKIKIFKTMDSIAEFANAGISATEKISKVEEDQLSFFDEKKLNLGHSSYVRDEGDLKEIKSSMRPPRRRFDYVIGNPPYVGYNVCAKQKLLYFQLLKEKKVKLSNVFGFNLHSVPGHSKKYPPKPNLYAFFVALGIALLKKDGKLCYIIPQTLLTEPDYDVLRYHLSNFTTVESITTFEGPMFIGRGLKQKQPVATSSMVIVVKNKVPSKGHKVTVQNFKAAKDLSFEEMFERREMNVLSVAQKDLAAAFQNWNFILKSPEFLKFTNEYKANSTSIACYFDHDTAQATFGARFYFDVGFIFDDKKSKSEKAKESDLQLISIQKKAWHLKLSLEERYFPNDEKLIELPKASQGLHSLALKHMIVWEKSYSTNFYYTEESVLPNMSLQQFIASSNKDELLYLLAILNSSTTQMLLKEYYQLGNEKVGLFVVVTRLKQAIRVPKLDGKNGEIKKTVINAQKRLLEIEEDKLSDYADLTKLMQQKFESVTVEGNKLWLEKDGKSFTAPIKKSPGLVSAALMAEFESARQLGETSKISLTSLKTLKIVDLNLQSKLRKYIDLLVFSMYFGIEHENLDLENIEKIEMKCLKSSHFKYIETFIKREQDN